MSTINSLLTSIIYPKKIISIYAVLFKYIHFRQISKETLKPLASNFEDYNLSCDWDRYSTPIRTRQLISKQYKAGSKIFKNENHYFICKLEVDKLSTLEPNQSFNHDPIFHFPPIKGEPNNRAHSLMYSPLLGQRS